MYRAYPCTGRACSVPYTKKLVPARPTVTLLVLAGPVVYRTHKLVPARPFGITEIVSYRISQCTALNELSLLTVSGTSQKKVSIK